jgi:HAD superfamily hydrolase (TIGR01484 family)
MFGLYPASIYTAEGRIAPMRYLALATDYDGTLATDGVVADATVQALRRLRDSGRHLILVTGRELDDLIHVFPHLDLFDRVVAENGAVLYRPSSHETITLGERPPEAFITALRERGVAPLSVGQVIVATWQPHEMDVLDAIRDLGVELQVIFNKGAVMVLPPGVNKGSGLAAALRDLLLSPLNAVGIGDAENDHALLDLCECAVAVANAVTALKGRADIVTQADHGAGVVEVIDHLIADDLADLARMLSRHRILLGDRDDGGDVFLPLQHSIVLVSGPSGSGKSSLVVGLVERLTQQGYQWCLIDPEGDYESMANATILGESHTSPSLAAIHQVLEQSDQSLIINLLGLPLADRPGFFGHLLLSLQELRARSGRPHWIIADEAHHLLPASWTPATMTLPHDLDTLMMLTVHPDQLAREVLAMLTEMIAIGNAPGQTLRQVSAALGQSAPDVSSGDLPPGVALMWSYDKGSLTHIRLAPSQVEHSRHVRKYAQGELGEDKSFYFRGPEGKLNLRAHNLTLFLQMAAGVDDATWQYHLQRHDYSRWFHDAIKDDDLAQAATDIENDPQLSPQESRTRVQAAIQERYSPPTS